MAGNDNSDSSGRSRHGRRRLHRAARLRSSQRRLSWSMAICTLVGFGLGLVLDSATLGAAIGLTLGLSIGLLLAA